MSDKPVALVTGGAGFIGSHLCGALAAQGVSVRVLDDLSSGSQANLKGIDVDLQMGRVDDRELVDRAISGAKWVFHLAAMISVPHSVEEPAGCYRNNLNGSLTVLQAAARYGVKRVVLASSAAVYGEAENRVDEASVTDPHSPYAAAKLAMEAAASLYRRRYRLPTVCLRLFNVYGPRQSLTGAYSAVIPAFIAAYLAGEPPVIHGDGSQERDFVYVGDVARAFILAAERKQAVGGVFNIAGGTTLRIDRLAGILQDEFKTGLEPRTGPRRAGDIGFSSGEIGAARAKLKFDPQVDIRKGLHSTVEWFRQKQALGAP